MKHSHKIILIIGGIAAFWLFTGLFSGSEEDEQHHGKSASLVEGLVKIERFNAQDKSRKITVNGSTEPLRKVEVKAEVEGNIVALPVKEGALVEEGAVLLRIDVRNRKENLRRAEALLEQRRIEYEAAKSLKSKGFRSKIGMAEAKANLEKARSELKEARLELEKTEIKAPFAGRLERLYVEVGDFVNSGVFSPGSAVAQFVSDVKLIAVGHVVERDRAALRVGSPAKVRLSSVGEIDGVVTFVGTVADEKTRSFRVEVEMDNSNRDLPVGGVAEIAIDAGSYAAYHVPSSILALDDNGKVGVKVLNGSKVVEFLPVEIIDQDHAGTWITGIGRSADIITQGAAFVSSGQTIEPAITHDDATVSEMKRQQNEQPD